MASALTAASSGVCISALQSTSQSATSHAARSFPLRSSARSSFLGTSSAFAFSAFLPFSSTPKVQQSGIRANFLEQLLGGGGSGAPVEQHPNAAGPDTDTPLPGCEFAAFGAGCFWGPELAFQRVPGVVKTEVGYTQGLTDGPTYEDICYKNTNHVEAVRVQYDPKECSYEQLLETFWSKHDPTTLNRQGGDAGTQYRSGIYFYTPEQEKIARESLEKVQSKFSRKIVTEILPAKKWYRAEEYHQQYLAKGGRFGMKQRTDKGCNDPIRCYG